MVWNSLISKGALETLFLVPLCLLVIFSQWHDHVGWNLLWITDFGEHHLLFYSLKLIGDFTVLSSIVGIQ